MIFNILIFLSFGISTFITLWIVYSGLDTQATSNYLTFYVLFVLFFILYVSVFFLAKKKKVRKAEIKKRIITFFIFLIALSGFLFIYQIFIKQQAVNYYRVFSPAIIISYWGAFSSLIFTRKRM